MSRVEELSELKDKVEKLRSQTDEAKGSLTTCMDQLKDKFECDTVEDAEKLLEEWEALETELEEDYQEAFDKIRDDWSEQLEA